MKPEDIYIHYKSIADFYAYLENGKTQPKYSDKDHSLRGRWKTAQDLMRFGDRDSLAKVKKVNGYINPNCLPDATIQKNVLTNRVCGGSVMVGAYLSGSSKCFRGRKRLVVPSRFVTINLLITDQCCMSDKDKEDGSCKLMAAIRILEANNIRCTVNILDNGVDSGYYQERGYKKHYVQRYVFSVCVKSAEAALNELVLAYPLINPDMMYYQAFRWAEVTKGLRFNGSYGGVLNLESTKNLAKLPGAWFNTRKLADPFLSAVELAKLIALEAK